jgi:GntR family transcriptional regulator, transcriptional repressor for pyruvate dehydrogenase complex
LGRNTDAVLRYSERERPSLSTDLVRWIIELIRNDDLRPGDRLPSVRALAERFLVTTPTIRQALGRLQTSGVVEIRHGSGVYVRSRQERVVLTNPSHNEIEPRTLLELLDARLLIEPRLAEMTARDVEVDEIAELQQILDKAEEYLGGERDEILNRANMGFHRAIANFSGNAILAQVVESLIELYSFEQLAIISFYNNRHRDHQEHLDILSGIRNGDAGRVRELMHRHISGVRSTVKARLAEHGVREGWRSYRSEDAMSGIQGRGRE